MHFDETKYNINESIVPTDGEKMGELETYGDDFKKVIDIQKHNPKTLWTILECDDGLHVSAGFHCVNRMNYLVTLEEWDSENEIYEWFLDKELEEQQQ